MSRSIALAVLVGCLLNNGASADAELDRLVACHDRAAGGPALRALAAVSYQLRIEEPGFSVDGYYRATRAGAMRIDVYDRGSRVFSEGWDGARGWQRRAGQATPTAIDKIAAAALIHGLQNPGHLWTLADMARNGHRLDLQPSATLDGQTFAVVKLTLNDGFETTYWLDPETCLIRQSRSVRAFHPDIDPTPQNIATVYEDYRVVDGVSRAFLSRNLDLDTGTIIATTRIIHFDTAPELGDDEMAGAADVAWSTVLDRGRAE